MSNMRSNTYRAEIDGLRAIAVIAVIMSHAGAPFKDVLPGGFLGVDIFFVLSGFLITGILTREFAAGTFSLLSFYERRVRRILPALILVVLASIPAAWILMSPSDFKGFGESLVSVGTFSSNFYFWMTSGYFAPSTESLPLIHTWSLAIEEQYYVFFPLIFMLLWRWNGVFFGLAALLVIGLMVAEHMAHVAPSAAFYLLPARAWELMAGSLAGYMAVRFGLPDGANGPRIWRMLGRYRHGLAWVGLLCIVGALTYFNYGFAIPGLRFLVPVVGTALLLLCLHPGGSVHWILTRKPLTWIGLISYSAYLWHQPIFAFGRLAQIQTPSPWFMVALIVLVFFLAWATWAFVEQPFRNRSLSYRPIILGSFGAMGTLVVFGFLVFLSSGMGHIRFTADKVLAFNSANPSPVRNKCHTIPADKACVYNAEATPTWSVVGDSHGVEVAYALGQMLKPFGEAVTHYTRSGCPPALLFETNRAGCAEWTQDVIDRIASKQSNGTVLLTYRHASYLYGVNEDQYPKLPDTPYRISGGNEPSEKRALYWASFEEIVHRFEAADQHVVLMLPVPELARDVKKLITFGDFEGSENWRLPGPNLSAIPKSYYLERTGEIRERLTALADKSPNVSVLDPAAAFCGDSYCYGVLGGGALYFDDDHPSIFGAELIVSSLISGDGWNGAALVGSLNPELACPQSGSRFAC